MKELEELKRKIRMMDTTSILNEILDSERNVHIKTGFGYHEGSSSGCQTVFVKCSTSGTTKSYNVPVNPRFKRKVRVLDNIPQLATTIIPDVKHALNFTTSTKINGKKVQTKEHSTIQEANLGQES